MRFSAFDIIKLAETMERRGADFYQAAANAVEVPEIKELFESLSCWEQQHLDYFIEMKQTMLSDVAGKFKLDCSQYQHVNPQVIDEIAQKLYDTENAEELTKTMTKEEIFRAALEREKMAIGYFNCIEELARDIKAERQLQQIIDEEEKHVRMLEKSLERFE